MIDNTNEKIIPVDIDQEMRKSYIAYAMSVIKGRALPDVRDGLKPVHRRILYAMHELGFTPDKGYRKCATTVGEVLGKYHPHGDAAVYDSLVRMAQDFSLRYPLIDGHGNFGSIDGDNAAAMRYTEARMSKISKHLLRDIEKDTVDYIPNYDDRLEEPSVVPSRFPNLLVNGSSGIAVGMATNIPPHNLTEVINGICATIDDENITIDELNEIIKGPDFPTGATILGVKGIKEAYETGRGKIRVKAKAEIIEKNNRQVIIVNEIPYQVNKAKLIEQIADCVKDGKIPMISGIRDESDRDGMRIVIEIKRDGNANVVLNQLYKHSRMQDTFSFNMLALVNNVPQTLNLKQMIEYYIEFQEEIIQRRTRYDLDKAQKRAHLLEGFLLALDNIDRVIEIIRGSQTVQEAKDKLIEEFDFSQDQAQAILDMRLSRLTGLEREKIENELAELKLQIQEFISILGDINKVRDIIKEELVDIRDKFGDERRSDITLYDEELNDEDLIQKEDVVITLTNIGYIKRMNLNIYKSQKRGGKGITGLSTREEDFVKTLFVASTHDHLMFFTNTGRVFRLRGFQIPETGRQAKGTAIVNLLQLEKDERITTVIPIDEFFEDKYLFMVTKKGIVKKTTLSDYDTKRKGGLIAISLDDDDQLICVEVTNGENDIVIATKQGKGIRFSEKDSRPLSRNTRGTIGIRLEDDDYVVGVALVNEHEKLLFVTENGYGKRTEFDDFRCQNRAGKGVISYKISQKTGYLASMTAVEDNDDVMIINSDGIIIRTCVNDISVLSRPTQGVKVMRADNEVSVIEVARVVEKDEEIEENEQEINENE